MKTFSPRIAAVLSLIAILAVAAPSAATSATSGRTLMLGGTECNLIPVARVPTAGPIAPIGTGVCPGVRPGALLQTDVGLCTFNFLFRGSDGYRYMGTAGHCIIGEGPFAEDAGERTWTRGSGPVVRDSDGRRVGEFAYAILQSPRDFALVRLDAGVTASARMCYFGGPIGINTSTASGPTVLHHWGNGLLLGDTVPGRTHVTPSLADPDSAYAYGAAMLGDSGAGVISSDGRAVGVLVTVGAHVAGALNHGVIGITRLRPQMDRAASRLRTTLTLQTAPF